MTLTQVQSFPRPLAIVWCVTHYYTLLRAQISDLLFPNDPDGRITRKWTKKLFADGLISRTAMEVVNPSAGAGASAPVYFPSRKGCEYLACELNDERYLSVCTQRPNWQYLLHWTAVSQFHIVLDRAIERQQDVRLERWLGEWDIADPDAPQSEPHRRYRLFQLIEEHPRRLVANPDAGFLLRVGNFAKAYFVEIDRATSGIQQIAASKTPGFAAMAQRRLDKQIYPEANVDPFAVLLITTSPMRRTLLQKAIAAKQGSELWKFCAWGDLKPETLLHEPIFFNCAGESAPLIRPQRGAS